MVTGWIACPVIDPAAIGTLREQLYGWLGAPATYQREPSPHVSVIGVRIPSDRTTAFEREFERFTDAVGGWAGSLAGYHLYPSARNPMVVTLAVPFDLAALASPIAELLADHNGRVERLPTRPHITLFKGGTRGEEIQWAQIDDRTRERLTAVLDVGATAFDPPPRLINPTFDVELGPPGLEWN